MSKKPKKSTWILASILGIIVLLIVAMLVTKPEAKPLPEATETAVAVSVLTVNLTNTMDVVYLPAMIEANIDATLAAEKSGRITQLNVSRGDHVKKGVVLLQIDDRIWQAYLKQATIAKRDAEKNFTRFKALQKSGAVAPSEYDRIEKDYITAQSMLEEANINIEQCRVLSPIDGIINDRFVEAGEYVQPGTPVYQVIDHATVKVNIQIPEKDIFSVKLGDRLSFMVSPLPDRIFEGVVTFIAAQGDDRNNAFRAELSVNNAEGELRPGMIAQLKFERGICHDMISLPMSAVLPSKGDHIVYLVKDGQAIRRKVQIEQITRERALISDGLEPGDLIITDGNRTLNDGQRVKVSSTGTSE